MGPLVRLVLATMTDERIDEALRRVAEILAEPYGRCCQTEAERAWLAGWAEAIRALSAEHESRKFTQDGECGGESCTSCKAFDLFVKAMLGG